MSTGEETLSPDELAALSEAFNANDRDERSSADIRSDHEPVVVRYDLVSAGGAQRHDFPALDLIHETYARVLGDTLQASTNDEAHFIPKPPDVLSFSEIYGSLSMPCCVVVLDIKGLDCSGLLVVDPGIFLTYVDRMMGGMGGGFDAAAILGNRGFTRTERHLFSVLVQNVHEAAVQAWGEIAPIEISMLRAVVDPRHSAVFMPSDQVIDFRLDVEWGEASGEIRLVFPMINLRPYQERLARTAVSPPSAGDKEWRVALRETLDDVPVEVTAVLGTTEMTLQQILNLSEGDLVRLDRDPNNPLDLLVEGVNRFAVRPRVSQGNLAAVMGDPINLGELPPNPLSPTSEQERAQEDAT
ncbi:MAG: FliM/FliN family flagellar motor switch protein [Myxococcota bacterium]|nr:FliM/FliN family flagellar motor switch protein [Myxococcota bacterium]